MSTKTCLVARGFVEKEDQIIRSDSPRCLWESVRLLFSIAVSSGLAITSVHIRCTFPQGYSSDRDIYIKPPQKANPDKLRKLPQVIYGFVDVSRAWYLRVYDEFHKLYAKVSKYDKVVIIW